MAKNKSKVNKESRVYKVIASLVVSSLLLIALLQFGIFGIFFDKVFRYLFGDFHIVVFVLLILVNLLYIFTPNKLKQKPKVIIGISILFISFLIGSSIFSPNDYLGFDSFGYFLANSSKIFNLEMAANGGFLGVLLFSILTALFDIYGTYIIVSILVLIGVILTFGTQIFTNIKLPKIERKPKVKKEKVKKEKNKKERKKKEVIKVVDKTTPYEIEDIPVVNKKKDSIFISLDNAKVEDRLTVSDKKSGQLALALDDEVKEPYVLRGKEYELPKLNLLDHKTVGTTSSKNSDSAKIKGEHLISVLQEFNIESELVATHIGPSVTKFEIRPDSSVKVSRISSISDNIKMELAAKSIRIEAPIPGKNTVGIEIPNVENTPVKLYDLLKDVPSSMAPLNFALGKDLTGNVIFSDLTKMPHLLIAGATGAGKSVALNAIITTILLRTTPEEVRLLLIDPKKVEFNSFAQAPHLMCNIINEPSQANTALMRIVDIMDDRYRKFAEINVKNIKAYNEYKTVNPEANLENLELLVVIIDELADLMIVAGKEVELSIQRITQLARAAGIHLIVATQRPSTDVITGVIKSNIPSRISFAVSSGIDSRTILDTVGAEKLLGNGDMLYYPVGYSAPLRLQGVYISDEEVVRVADFAAKQVGPDHFDQFIFEAEDGSNFQVGFASTDDVLYEEVREFVIREQKASTSLLQRSFAIGYNRAARLVDALEQNGVVGPMNGSKPREVLETFIADEDLEDLEL